MSEKKTRTTRAPSYAEAYLCVVLVFGLVIGAMILGVPVQATMLFVYPGDWIFHCGRDTGK